MATRVRRAMTWSERAIGLLKTPSLGEDEGLWLSPCAAVHTFGMRYPIDVLFLDSLQRVLRIDTLKAWRMSRWVFRAQGVLELPAGTAARTGVHVGDQLVFEDQR